MTNRMKIDQALLDKLEGLCAACPKGAYRQTCPFRLLNTLSHASRTSLLKSMTLEQVQGLFDLVLGCACPVQAQIEKSPGNAGQIELGEELPIT